MYSSNNSLNGNNLISYSTPFSFESNQTSTKEYENETINCPPFSFFHFPYSPFEDNQIFLQQQHHHDSNFQLHHHQSLPETTALAAVSNTDASASASAAASINPPEQGTNILEQIPRKRTNKRDRHSKIKTARGLRDRRMRLSLEVAKRFFGLQDMLGFEKASKTVEWLLNQAKVEIKQLAREKNIVHPPSCSSVGGTGAKSASSTSECEEGVSSLDEVVERKPHAVVLVKRRVNKVSRKSAFNPIGREKARERARERTREKMKNKRLAASADAEDESNSKQCNDGKNHNINLLWNPFETVEESAGTTHQTVNPSSFDVQLQAADRAEEPSSHAKEQHSGTVEDDDSLFIMSKWSPTMMFSSLNSSGLILQEHQFAQFQSLEKTWEAYNNRI